MNVYEGVGFDGPLLLWSPLTGLTDGYLGVYTVDARALTLSTGAPARREGLVRRDL